jgi:protein-disulfide isomerase
MSYLLPSEGINSHVCRQFATGAWPRLLADYVRPGRVQVVFRNLPLESIHPRARELATAAVCADRQGTFEVVHDRLFLERPADPDWSVLANVPGLDFPQFAHCVESSGSAAVDRDVEFAKSLSVSATPTLMFGTLTTEGKSRILLRRDGAMSMDEIKSVLARALSVED